MSKPSIKIKHKNPKKLNAIMAKIKESPDVVLAVGFPGNLVGGVRYPVKKEFGRVVDGTPPRVIDVAAKNEFGTEGVQARPFMKQSSKDVKIFLHNKYKKKNFIMAGGKMNKKQAKKFLASVAAEIEAIIDLRIQNLTEPSNSPVTVAIKGSSNPLIDTGLMRQTVTSDLRTKKK